MDENNTSKTIYLEKFNDKNKARLSKYNKIKKLKMILPIIVLFTALIIYYIYSYSSSLMIVDIGPSISLKINKWDRVVDASSVDSLGNTILNENNIKNKNINDALMILLGKAEANNYIDPLDKSGLKNNISIFISGDSLNISKFYNKVKTKQLNLNINDNGVEKKY